MDLQHQLPQIDSFLSKCFQSLSQPVFQEVRSQHIKEKAPSFSDVFFDPQEDPGSFTSHLSYTMGNFSNESHLDNDASPYTFVMWIPINEKSGELIENSFDVKNGEFVFPKDGFGIDFQGHDGVVECAFKATTHYHHRLPSTSPASSFHTCLGLSAELPLKTLYVLKRIQNKEFVNKKDWFFRDLEKIVVDSFNYLKPPKEKKNSDEGPSQKIK